MAHCACVVGIVPGSVTLLAFVNCEVEEQGMNHSIKTACAVCAFAVCGLLSGCATSTQTRGPDGHVSYTITCSGMALSWADCQKKAGDLCGAQGYRVELQTGDKGWNAAATGAGAFGGSVITRNMLIECGKGAA